MKKLYLFTALTASVILFSSFNTPLVPGNNFSSTGTTTGTAAFPFCSGDYVVMEITDNYETSGVSNNNRAMVTIKHHYTGTGFSILSGERYTMDTHIDSHANLPVTRGAMVMQDFVSDDLKGDNGGLQSALIRIRSTYNANGEKTSDRYDVSAACH